jgi:excisionase family DNA binding protein
LYDYYLPKEFSMLSAKEAQAMLGVSLRSIYCLAKSGAIAHYRFGSSIRFEEAQLLAYKESCKVATRVQKEITVSRVNVSSTGEKSALLEYFEKAGIKVRHKPYI